MHRNGSGDNAAVVGDFDVVVAGGGPAGVAAAFAAARLGAKTLILEQFNCLGGVATAGGHGHICRYSAWDEDLRVVGGIPYEMARRVTEFGCGIYDRSRCDFEVEGMKLVLEKMAEECETHLLYHTFCAGAIVENGLIKEAIIQSKSGRQTVRAKQFIDCTGDGDLAAWAGCGFDYGDPDTGACQPVTLMFTIGGVNWNEVRRFRDEYSRKNPGDGYKLSGLWKEAQQNGDMRPFQHCIMGWWWTPTRPDQVGVNFTHVNYVDSRNAAQLTAATIEARKQAYETIAVYRKYVPGMENCYMISSPATIGIRESRRIHAEHTLSRQEVTAQASFPDSIGYGSFFIDIHNCTGPGMDRKEYRPPKGFRYQIPYRICVAKGLKNLQVAGRCAGADHEALGSLRVMPQCGIMGQAAGTAAALALKENKELRSVRVSAIQSALKAADCILDEDDIAAHNR